MEKRQAAGAEYVIDESIPFLAVGTPVRTVVELDAGEWCEIGDSDEQEVDVLAVDL